MTTDPGVRRFDGKVALVTGAARGIGKATAIRLAQEGARVVIADIDEAGLTSTLAELPDGFALRLDLGDPASIEAVVNQAAEWGGKLDVLCNVAGILRTSHSHEMPLDLWDQIIRINLTGTFLMCRAAIPHLLKSRGNIVNLSSTAAIAGHPWMAAYSASKGGILSMTRALASEYVKRKIRINAVLPGGIDTPMHGDFAVPEGGDATILMKMTPMVRYVGPEYAASVVAFLASDDARYINGGAIRVDGGMFT